MNFATENLVFDPQIIRRFDINGPRYTSYPTADRFVEAFRSDDYVRAAPGGTGEAKCAGNYAASLIAQAEAADHGCDQVVWLDASERLWIEEMGGMNLFFVYGSGPNARVVTPELTGSLLPGVTRESLLVLAAVIDGKPAFLAAATADLVAGGVHAGNIVREVAKAGGGGGGGRPDMAQAGSKSPEKIQSAVEQAGQLIKGKIQ